MNIKELHSVFVQSKGITTDSRKIQTKAIFFALKGENFNGNEYAEQALKEGASYVVIDEQKYAFLDRSILVENVLKTLQELANYHRNFLRIPIIGITGSNGKTTTKELVSTVLAARYKVGFTQGNFNNHIGVPLTLLSFTKETEIGVVEMGANHIGEIKELCDIANPDYGIITNIGKAHIEGFGSFEGIVKTKSELYDYLKNNNKLAFVNIDDELLMKQSMGLKTFLYGKSELSHIVAKFVKSAPYLELQWSESDIKTKLVGAYNFYNALVAIAIGNYFKVETSKIIEALANYTPSNNRSQLTKTERNTLIIDAYNANPTSMTIAIKNFIDISDGAKTLILGDMFELGDSSKEEHMKIISLVSEMGFDSVFFVGETFFKLSIQGQAKFSFHKTTDDLYEYLKHNSLQDKIILLKASRGIKLEKVIELL